MQDTAGFVMDATEGGKRKLTWDEMQKIMKRKRVKNTRYGCKGDRYRKRMRKYQKKLREKKKLKRQEEHPEEILAKRKFWVIKR